MMDADQKFFLFVDEWAKSRGCKFVAQGCDGRECDHLIDGMAVDDVWGWMLPKGVKDTTDDKFGCVVWHEVNGHLTLEWETNDN